MPQYRLRELVALGLAACICNPLSGQQEVVRDGLFLAADASTLSRHDEPLSLDEWDRAYAWLLNNAPRGFTRDTPKWIRAREHLHSGRYQVVRLTDADRMPLLHPNYRWWIVPFGLQQGVRTYVTIPVDPILAVQSVEEAAIRAFLALPDEERALRMADDHPFRLELTLLAALRSTLQREAMLGPMPAPAHERLRGLPVELILWDSLRHHPLVARHAKTFS